jgi:DHA2 family multidrug resistance protein
LPSNDPASEVDLTSESEYRLDLRRILIVVSVMLAVLLEIIDTSIVNVALPSMMGNLGASLDEADWIITGYIISNVIIIPMTSWLAGRFGRKRYFVTSILVFTGASLLCGLSTSVAMLVGWRIVQGLGGGALLATSQTILIESFPPSRQGVGQAIFGVGAMIGPSLGPTLGGWLTDVYSWHWIFLINVPLGIAAAGLCASQLRDPPHARARRGIRVDWIGIVFLVIGIGALQTLLERGNRLDWFASTEVQLLAVASVVGLVALVIRELNTDEPVVDLRVLRRTPLAVGCTLGILMGVALYGSVFLFPLYTQTLLGWTAWNSGLAILPSSLATAVVMVVVGRLVWKVGPRALFMIGMAVTLCALWGMSRWTLASGWDDILTPQILRGIGMGLMFVPLSTATLRALPTAEVAKGAGLYNLFRQLGGSLGIALLTTVLDHRADVHRTALAEQLSPLGSVSASALSELGRTLSFQGMSFQEAQVAAAAILQRLLEAQASLEAFSDAYTLIAILFAAMVPLAVTIARHAPGRFAPVE